MQESLMQETRRLLKESDKSLLEIHKESGISFYWLRRFSSGYVKDPSVNTIQELYEYLTGKALLNNRP